QIGKIYRAYPITLPLHDGSEQRTSCQEGYQCHCSVRPYSKVWQRIHGKDGGDNEKGEQAQPFAPKPINESGPFICEISAKAYAQCCQRDRQKDVVIIQYRRKNAGKKHFIYNKSKSYRKCNHYIL